MHRNRLASLCAKKKVRVRRKFFFGGCGTGEVSYILPSILSITQLTEVAEMQSDSHCPVP